MSLLIDPHKCEAALPLYTCSYTIPCTSLYDRTELSGTTAVDAVWQLCESESEIQ